MKKKEKIEPIDISFSKLAKMIVRTKINKKSARKSNKKNATE